MKRKGCQALIALLLVGLAWAGLADDVLPLETRLTTFARQLQLGMTLSSVAIHSPSLADLHTHAQQLINLLEGAQGRHFVRSDPSQNPSSGLMEDFAGIRQRFEQAEVSGDMQALLFSPAKNVRTYLSLALSSALRSIEQRRLDLAVLEMMQAYAFLSAAYGKPCDAPYVPALWTILRAFNLDHATSPEEG